MLILINIFNRSHTRYWSMLLIKKRKEKDIEVSWVIKKHGHDKTPSIPCLTCVGHRHVGETIACVSLVCWEVSLKKKKKKKFVDTVSTWWHNLLSLYLFASQLTVCLSPHLDGCLG